MSTPEEIIRRAGFIPAEDASPNGAKPADPSSWLPVDLALIIEGGVIDQPPALLSRSDGQMLLYPGKIHSFNGEPESGKSWLALFLCAQQLRLGATVVYLDFEDSPASVVGRLLALEVGTEDIAQRFVYVRPQERLEDASLIRFVSLLQDRKPSVVVIDGVTEAMSLYGLSINANDDIATFMAALPRRFVRWGAACAMLDHVTKNRETQGRWAIGGQHKMAGIDGACYTIQVVKPFGRGRTGVARIEVTKDRPGYVRGAAFGGRHVAEFEIDASASDVAVVADLRAPTSIGEDGTFRPTVLMERASRALEAHPGGLSSAEWRASFDGSNKTRQTAMNALISEGFVTVFEEGRKRLNKSERSFRDE